jgi:hypothetical protein
MTDNRKGRRLRRLAGLALLSVAVPMAAYAGAMVDQETMILTRVAPTTDATEGLNLDGLKGFRVCVAAASAQTLSGAGTLDAYLYDYNTARWAINPGLALTQSTSGVRDRCFPDQRVSVPTGRVLYAANGITVSGGTTVVVTLIGFK